MLTRGARGVSLTRNEAAVHEKVGRYGNITLGDVHGLVLNEAIDQRLFLSHWRFAFAVELPGDSGPRRSLQIFDEAGDAVLKIHLRATSDLDAFEALAARFAAAPAPIASSPAPPAASAAASGNTDVEAFRREFDTMQDVHEFFPLLKRHEVTPAQRARPPRRPLRAQAARRHAARACWNARRKRRSRSCASSETAAASRSTAARWRR